MRRVTDVQSVPADSPLTDAPPVGRMAHPPWGPIATAAASSTNQPGGPGPRRGGGTHVPFFFTPCTILLLP